MVKRPECISHSAVQEYCRGLAVSRGGNDAVRNVPRPTPGSPESTHHVREVGFSTVLPNNPEPRRTPAGPGIQASLKVSNLAGTVKKRDRDGRPIDKGHIYKLLSNRTYLGELRHKDQWY